MQLNNQLISWGARHTHSWINPICAAQFRRNRTCIKRYSCSWPRNCSRAAGNHEMGWKGEDVSDKLNFDQSGLVLAYTCCCSLLRGEPPLVD